MTETTFEDKAVILADLWTDYRNDENFADFIAYNDLGLPLAYCIANKIISSTPTAEKFIDEAFGLLLTSLEQEDTGFTSLNELLQLSQDE